jgi:hypothetical protein
MLDDRSIRFVATVGLLASIAVSLDANAQTPKEELAAAVDRRRRSRPVCAVDPRPFGRYYTRRRSVTRQRLRLPRYRGGRPGNSGNRISDRLDFKAI